MRILIADDHTLIFNGIKILLEDEHSFVVLPNLVQRYQDLLPALQHYNPDLLLLDINLRGENALDLLPKIRDSFLNLKVFIISMYSQNGILEKATEGGICGFLTKDLTLDELLYAFKFGTPSKPYISSGVDVLYPEKYIRRDLQLLDTFTSKFELSKRELEIVRLVAGGKTTKVIAKFLFLSPHTIHTHRRNILTKIGLHSTAELVKWAFENKI